MTRSSSARAGLYLLAALAVFLFASMLSSPVLAALLRLVAVLILCAAEAVLSETRRLPFPLRPKKETLPTLLFFPVFLFLTLAVNLLSSYLIRLLGGTLPTVAHTPATFVSAVLLAPLTEELFFRGLILHCFVPYGEKKAILLSALAFALAHASIFQIPYAFVAGLLLATVAVLSDTVLFPLAFHIAYNLLTYFGDAISPFLLLAVSGITATAAFAAFLSRHRAHRSQDGKPLVFREMIPYGIYAVFLLYLTVSAVL